MEAVERITKLYNEPKLMEYYSKKSKEFAKQFTWEKTAETFEHEINK